MNEHGILLLDKDSGITSTRALTAAKKCLQLKKAGHGGTLDPLANGLLVLLFGEATHYAQYLLTGDKRYVATLRFGYTSDSDDAEGVLTPVAPVPAALGERLTALLPAFRGEISQTAPLYSALKHQGKPLYSYARNNIAVPAKTRRVRISSLTLEKVSGECATITVAGGGGLYIRALARDIGAQLGCGAYLSALQRTHCGDFNLADAVRLETLAAKTPAACRQRLLPIETTVTHLPAITLPEQQLQQLGTGMGVKEHPLAPDNTVRVLSPGGRFAGLAEYRDGCYHPLRFLHWTRQPRPQ